MFSSLQVRKTRAKIGLGVTLSLESDGVWLYNRSSEPVFVSSPALDAAAAKALLVWRLAPGHCLCIFDPSCPPPAVSLPHIGPVDPRSVRISFAKGWGPKYSRRDVTACPCWLEVLLAPPSWPWSWVKWLFGFGNKVIWSKIFILILRFVIQHNMLFLF